jgi:CheY-like chemotaxis protein
MTQPEQVAAKRVLVVEDDLGTAEAIAAILGDEGYAVDLVANGREALVRIVDARPDVILLDMMMPVMDGPETSRALQADPRARTIPVVVMTVSNQLLERSELPRAGVIVKPFDLEELLDTVAAAIATGDQ